jgi:hypothetical protein
MKIINDKIIGIKIFIKRNLTRFSELEMSLRIIEATYTLQYKANCMNYKTLTSKSRERQERTADLSPIVCLKIN